MRWFIASIFSSPRPAAKRSPYRSRLGVELLEDRLTPAGFFLTGVGGFTNPAEPNLRIYDSTNPAGGAASFRQPPGDIGTFPGFSGSVRVATGDVNGDGIGDFITAQGDGVGSGSQVRIFDGRSALFSGTAVQIASFFAYGNSAGASTTPDSTACPSTDIPASDRHANGSCTVARDGVRPGAGNLGPTWRNPEGARQVSPDRPRPDHIMDGRRR